MFTKEDYEGYFQAIQKADRDMLKNVAMILKEVTDPDVVKVLTHIKEDEQRHIGLSDELFGLLEEEAA